MSGFYINVRLYPSFKLNGVTVAREGELKRDTNLIVPASRVYL